MALRTTSPLLPQAGTEQACGPTHGLEASAKNVGNGSSYEFAIFRIVKAHVNQEVGTQCLCGIVQTEQDGVCLNPPETASASQWPRPGRFPDRRLILSEDQGSSSICFRHAEVQMPVLVDIAEALQRPKRVDIKWHVDPAHRARLQTADRLFGTIANTLKPAPGRLQPIFVLVYDRKFVTPTRVLAIGENQLPNHVIKCRSQVVQDLPDPYRPLNRRDWRSTSVDPCLGVRIPVDFMNDRVLDGRAEGVHIGDEHLYLGIGTSNLCRRTPEISHEPDLAKLSASNASSAELSAIPTSHP